MKTLELKLKKDVLIVDAEGLEITQALIFNKFGNYNLSYYDYICKGSELTEEIASELVEEHYMSGVRSYEIYNDYRYNDARWLDNALESFISAVESKEKFLLETPIEKPINYDLWAKYGDFTQYGKKLTKECLKWQEAEEKTFKNPLIFVKNYV